MGELDQALVGELDQSLVVILVDRKWIAPPSSDRVYDITTDIHSGIPARMYRSYNRYYHGELLGGVLLRDLKGKTPVGIRTYHRIYIKCDGALKQHGWLVRCQNGPAVAGAFMIFIFACLKLLFGG